MIPWPMGSEPHLAFSTAVVILTIQKSIENPNLGQKFILSWSLDYESIVTSMRWPKQHKRVWVGSHFCGTARLTLIYRVHFHSGVLSPHDPLWAPTRHPAATCVHWPMPFSEEPCWQLVSPCRRAHMKQQPELKPERAEAMVYDPDAQTGPRCPACLLPPAQLDTD